MSQTHRLSGVALAAAAATLFLAGCASEGSAPAKTADSSAVTVKCYGANSCKGQAECKQAAGKYGPPSRVHSDPFVVRSGGVNA